MASYSEDQRAELAAQGKALPDGSYPMPDCGAVTDALTAFPEAPETHRSELASLIRRLDGDYKCGHNLDGLDKHKDTCGCTTCTAAGGDGGTPLWHGSAATSSATSPRRRKQAGHVITPAVRVITRTPGRCR